MEVQDLSFIGMLSYFHRAIAGMVDPRSASNATRYSLKDAVLGAFASFFMQNESFLEYQRQLNSRCGRDNAQSLFGLVNIPTIEQIKNIRLFVTCYGSIGGHKSTKSLSGKRLN
jgi:hypothetical protein